MNVFDLNSRLIEDYSSYIRSFIQIRDERINKYAQECLDHGLLWPEPLIQLNPSFQPGEWIDELVEKEILHQECSRIFRLNKDQQPEGQPLRLHKHQTDAIKAARAGDNYVLTTGTGSGKSLAYLVPIVDYVLRHGSGRGIRAMVIYPMNALANSQYGELEKFLHFGYPEGKGPVTFEKYTGQESEEQKTQIIENPPDILLTNYVMLELILTRVKDKNLIRAAKNLNFLALDGIEREEVDYIMETFPLVKRKDEANCASYRTKEKILEIYNKMKQAIETGRPYQTLLDPPPGPLAVWPLPPGQPWPSHLHPPRDEEKRGVVL